MCYDFQIFHTSPTPSKKRTIDRNKAPRLAAHGVVSVNIAVDKIPNPSVYFPPNFCATRPPGMCVIM